MFFSGEKIEPPEAPKEIVYQIRFLFQKGIENKKQLLYVDGLQSQHKPIRPLRILDICILSELLD